MESIFEFICHYLQPLINSVGLLFDIFGAVLVASEVVDQFNGKQLKPMPGILTQGAFGGPLVAVVPSAEKTDEYKKWEVAKYRNMKIGLGCLIAGFIFQIVSNWVPYFTA